MQSIARISDLHECADTGPNAGATLQIEQGSPNIMINGLPAARVGDSVSCRMATGSAPVIAEGSSTVLFNGKPAARMGDTISNGGSINQGSNNIFIGDGECLISIGDDVQVEFGNNCLIYLNCSTSTSPNSNKKTAKSKSNILNDIMGIGLMVTGIPLDEIGVGEAMQAEGAGILLAEETAGEAAADESATSEEISGEITEKKSGTTQPTENPPPTEPTAGDTQIKKCDGPSTCSDPKVGDKVYRVWGDGAAPNGRSWTRTDPSSVPNYRDIAGLPDLNSGRFISEGTLIDIEGVVQRSALPLDNNTGGLDELIIPNPTEQIEIESISGINPEY